MAVLILASANCGLKVFEEGDSFGFAVAQLSRDTATKVVDRPVARALDEISRVASLPDVLHIGGTSWEAAGGGSVVVLAGSTTYRNLVASQGFEPRTNGL
jgi:hypothetical protein